MRRLTEDVLQFKSEREQLLSYIVVSQTGGYMVDSFNVFQGLTKNILTFLG